VVHVGVWIMELEVILYLIQKQTKKIVQKYFALGVNTYAILSKLTFMHLQVKLLHPEI